jgi:uncharacterized membrane protein (DUF4010 family)
MFHSLMIPLIASGFVAVIYGLIFTLKTISTDVPESAPRGRPFRLTTALAFAIIFAAMQFMLAALNAWLGSRGVFVAAAVAGFADAHSPAVSVASLVASGKLGVEDAVVPILAAFSTNTVTKVAVAVISGGKQFALQVIPGLILVVLAFCFAALYSRLHFL